MSFNVNLPKSSGGVKGSAQVGPKVDAMNEIHQFSRSCRPLSSLTTFAEEDWEDCNSEAKLVEVEDDGQLRLFAEENWEGCNNDDTAIDFAEFAERFERIRQLRLFAEEEGGESC